MVDPGDTVTNTLKKEFGEEALNSLEVSPEENKRIQESLEHLFHHGTMVIVDYESHNTQNESERAFSPTPSPGLAFLYSVIGTEKLAYPPIQLGISDLVMCLSRHFRPQSLSFSFIFVTKRSEKFGNENGVFLPSHWPRLIFKIGFWVECGYRVMDAGGKFGERGGSIRGGRGAAKRNLSFLSAL